MKATKIRKKDLPDTRFVSSKVARSTCRTSCHLPPIYDPPFIIPAAFYKNSVVFLLGGFLYYQAHNIISNCRVAADMAEEQVGEV